jgi:hypothetical protein
VGFFSRTAPEVKTARAAWTRGDRLYQCGVQMSADINPNVLLNEIAATGWDIAAFTVVFENAVPYSVYLFRRVEPPAGT